ncbi:MAG: Holliday junction branch migration protein RuvA [Streptococcaceae bacterium]|jgi:Holliday junction DNA helicase RuvA|nr:Holliday junction branch migration protein RuvA [Streptococcaceae bacterium]
MYEYLTGTITKITPTYIVLEAYGVGYQLSVANPYAFSSQLNKTVQVYVHQVIREDAHTLYGFVDAAEKSVFLKLIGVTGIGPKSALAIIARGDNAGLAAAIESSNVTYLTKFPGVGKKTAMQMVLDLAGKFSLDAQEVVAQSPENTVVSEALEALTALGYKAAELKKIESKLTAENPETAEIAIKLALKMLVK